MSRERVAAYLAKRGVCGPWPMEGSACCERVIVIPVLAEESTLFATLDGLAVNEAGLLAKTAVICVVNNREAPEVSSEVIAENARTLVQLRDAQRTERYPFTLCVVDASSPGRALPPKEGVGLARKIGLDHAAQMCPDGVLISLDGDTTVDSHYLERVTAHFRQTRSRAAVVEYAHPLGSGGEFNEAMARYEIFLRYHVLGLSLAGSPYAFHTIGSAMACRSEAYAAVGGMGRKQAGEDFYFLQALAKLGPMGYIGDTVVRPSARQSWRVPFGTGRALSDAADGDDRLLRLYDPAVYAMIGTVLDTVGTHGGGDGEGLLARLASRHEVAGAYLEEQGFSGVWDRLRSQSRDDVALMAQFHRWFDAFRTLRFVHYVRDNGFPSWPMADAAATLVRQTGRDVDWTEAHLTEATLRTMVAEMGALTKERMTK